jgi:sterol desaturase/sphingolipid hydroxylase (fatty acid hydroxylase superfamily)
LQSAIFPSHPYRDKTVHLTDLVPILQMAIGPVILISGVGLLLLSMTNRLGRAIDRARVIAEELRTAMPSERPRLAAQLKILSRRARLLRLAIILAILSVLLAGLLILALFLAALLNLEIAGVVIIVFAGCMISLIASLVVFIADINLSLSALALEISADGAEG